MAMNTEMSLERVVRAWQGGTREELLKRAADCVHAIVDLGCSTPLTGMLVRYDPTSKYASTKFGGRDSFLRFIRGRMPEFATGQDGSPRMTRKPTGFEGHVFNKTRARYMRDSYGPARESEAEAELDGEDLLRNVLGGELCRAMATLGHTDREVLELVYVLGLEEAEAASKLGIGIDALRTRLNRAVKKLVPVVIGVDPIDIALQWVLTGQVTSPLPIDEIDSLTKPILRELRKRLKREPSRTLARFIVYLQKIEPARLALSGMPVTEIACQLGKTRDEILAILAETYTSVAKLRPSVHRTSVEQKDAPAPLSHISKTIKAEGAP